MENIEETELPFFNQIQFRILTRELTFIQSPTGIGCLPILIHGATERKRVRSLTRKIAYCSLQRKMMKEKKKLSLRKLLRNLENIKLTRRLFRNPK